MIEDNFILQKRPLQIYVFRIGTVLLVGCSAGSTSCSPGGCASEIGSYRAVRDCKGVRRLVHLRSPCRWVVLTRKMLANRPFRLAGRASSRASSGSVRDPFARETPSGLRIPISRSVSRSCAQKSTFAGIFRKILGDCGVYFRWNEIPLPLKNAF